MGKATGRAGACILVFMALAAASVQARGDDAAPARSIASAQEFLRQVLPHNHYQSTLMTEIVDKARREGLRAHYQPLPPIIDAEVVGHCRSMMLADIEDVDLVVRDPDTGDTAVSNLADMVNDPMVGSDDGFHFGTIYRTRQDGSRVYLGFGGQPFDAVVHLESREMAGRVRAAFDYLREECWEAAAAGF